MNAKQIADALQNMKLNNTRMAVVAGFSVAYYPQNNKYYVGACKFASQSQDHVTDYIFANQQRTLAGKNRIVEVVR